MQKKPNMGYGDCLKLEYTEVMLFQRRERLYLVEIAEKTLLLLFSDSTISTMQELNR